MKIKKILRIVKARPTSDGAGVKLRRVFGYNEIPDFDPFLLFDHFGSDNPDDYMAGFPWHPHRGIETVTYMLKGSVEHGDSMGNAGIIETGDVQWMTAGNGIIHQEMPQGGTDGMAGFQLWVNLPASEKMMDPRYREVKSKEIPEVYLKNGIMVKVLAGKFMDATGPVQDLIVECNYFDVSLKKGSVFKYNVIDNKKVILYVYEGSIFMPEDEKEVESHHAVILGEGNLVEIAGKSDAKVLLFSGEPINEPIHWGGPIVMSTKEDLRQAFDDYNNGTFIR
ncbi:MAG: pirin family protein [Eubacteriales bacterium]|nr:pirin family protein [Eubacteriales bacterium]